MSDLTQYTAMAQIYDSLMAGIDYDEWAQYICALLDAGNVSQGRMALDLACGTGSTTIALARRGYQVMGLDLAADMLDVARKKAQQESLPIIFGQADMRNFILPEPVDLVVAFQDGLNYLLNEDDLLQTFSCVARVMMPGGHFIFDINHVEKLPRGKEEPTVVETPEFTLIYESSFINDHIWEIGVTGFIPVENDLYRRFREVHRERVIPAAEVRQALQRAGLKLMGTYGAFTLDAPHDETRRVFYVAGKEAS